LKEFFLAHSTLISLIMAAVLVPKANLQKDF